MSTVLWANYLLDGEVVSDESDKGALFKHSEKLDGAWKTANDALAILDGLLHAITTDKPRFGVMKNDYDAIVTELSESVEFAKKAGAAGAKFNFSVVM